METTNEIRILALSDLHLGYPRGELRQFKDEDVLFAIKQVAKLVSESNYDCVIIAGDIFNSTEVNGEEIRLLNKLSEALKPVKPSNILCIRGNHDRDRYSIPKYTHGFVDLNDTVVTIGGFKIAGCNYSSGERHREFLRTADADILVCHFPMSPFASFGDNPITIDECPDDKVVIVGDTHKPDVCLKANKAAVSPGCLFPANKSELLSGFAGSCYDLVVSRDESGELGVIFTQNMLISRFGVSLASIKTSDELLAALNTIEPTEGFPGKKVAYVNPDLIDKLPDDYVGIATVTADEVEDTVIEVAGLEGDGVKDMSKKLLSEFFKDSPDSSECLELATDLLESADFETVINQFLRR